MLGGLKIVYHNSQNISRNSNCQWGNYKFYLHSTTQIINGLFSSCTFTMIGKFNLSTNPPPLYNRQVIHTDKGCMLRQ